MRLRILASARGDLEEGCAFYESQEEGVGEYFLASVKADIESLRLSAGIHPIKHRDYHRMLCRVFPFAVFYTRTADEVIIHAVVDCRRQPDWIRHRLQR